MTTYTVTNWSPSAPAKVIFSLFGAMVFSSVMGYRPPSPRVMKRGVGCVDESRARHSSLTFIFSSVHSRGPRASQRAIDPLPRPSAAFVTDAAAPLQCTKLSSTTGSG